MNKTDPKNNAHSIQEWIDNEETILSTTEEDTKREMEETNSAWGPPEQYLRPGEAPSKTIAIMRNETTLLEDMMSATTKSTTTISKALLGDDDSSDEEPQHPKTLGPPTKSIVSVPEKTPPKKKERMTKEQQNAKRRVASKCPDLIAKITMNDLDLIYCEIENYEEFSEGEGVKPIRKAKALLVDLSNPDVATSGLKNLDASMVDRLWCFEDDLEDSGKVLLDLGTDKRGQGLNVDHWRKLVSLLAIPGKTIDAFCLCPWEVKS